MAAHDYTNVEPVGVDVPKSPFPTLRDMAEKAGIRDRYIQADLGELADVCNTASVATTAGDRNRYAAESAKNKCLSGHRRVEWHNYTRTVVCVACGALFADLQPLRDQVKQQGMPGNWDADEYMRGMFNGLECALATLEGREPRYK